MGACSYCSKPAGLLRSECDDCLELRRVATSKIPEFIARTIDSQLKPDRFQILLTEVARTHHINDEELHKLSIAGMLLLKTSFPADHVLTAEEECHICTLGEALGVTVQDMEAQGLRGWMKGKEGANVDEGVTLSFAEQFARMKAG